MLTAPNAPKFIVRGDIKAFYANVQHDWFMKHIIMDKEILQEFLSAGHVFAGELFPTNGLGISEGSNIAPILSNLILNGLQKHIYNALGTSRTKDFDTDPWFATVANVQRVANFFVHFASLAFTASIFETGALSVPG